MQLLDQHKFPSRQKIKENNKLKRKGSEGLISVSESSISLKLIKEPQNKKTNSNKKIEREDEKANANRGNNMSKNKKNK